MTAQSLSESLQNLFKELGHEKKVKQMQIVQKWKEIVGASIGEVAVPDQVRDDILFVRVKSTSWKTELTLQKGELLRKIEKSVGKGLLQDIRFIS
ncbi:DUF721 domain-containing protein [candidate division KSB1 bacterium]|nr:DUF721 domain-containing protein [candidate division KSB1 bacterium]